MFAYTVDMVLHFGVELTFYLLSHRRVAYGGTPEPQWATATAAGPGWARPPEQQWATAAGAVVPGAVC